MRITDYRYRVTLSATGIDAITADVTVTVLKKPDISCFFRNITLMSFEGYAGGPDIPISFVQWDGDEPGRGTAYEIELGTGQVLSP